MAYTKTFVEAFFQALELRNVRYSVLRNWEGLPSRLDGSDIDLVVHPDDSSDIEDVILAASIQSNVRILGQSRLRPDFARYFVVGVNTAGDAGGVSIDIFFGLYYKGGCELSPVESMLRNSDYHNQIRVLREDVAAIIAVLKEVLHNLEIPARYVDRARRVMEEDRELLNELFCPVHSRTWSYLEKAMRQADLRDRKRLLRSFRRSVLTKSFFQHPVKFASGVICNYFSLIRRLIAPAGKVVAVLGVDGAGKSTNIAAVAPLLMAATHGAFVLRHLRPRLLPPLSVLRGPSGVLAQADVAVAPHAKSASNFLGSVFRTSYLLADYILGYWLIVRPVICKSPTVFLFDRYAYDLELDARRYRINLPPNVIKFFVGLAPKPDVTICLYGDPVRVSARKGELSTEEVFRQTEAIKAFARVHANAVLVSTDCDVAESSAKVLSLICGIADSLTEEGRVEEEK